MQPIFFTNTLTKKKELLETIIPQKVRFYTCGPTVYGPIHLGNLRSALVADLIVRVLKASGYEVNYVRNFTDVDDKIIQKMHQKGLSLKALTDQTIAHVESDFLKAGMMQPTHSVRVSEVMPQILQFIKKLIDQKKAYETYEGEVFFEIDQASDYGKLSKKRREDFIQGTRVKAQNHKKNLHDFVLWKPAKPNEPYWDSPWGPGRPGWHIECSAIIHHFLGDQIDLHHGGEDLIFPHHENEIAQSECMTDCAPFVKIWVHHSFLTVDQTKMSKSLGNALYATEFLDTHGSELTRMLCFSTHYKSPLEVSQEKIEVAKKALERIYEAKKKAKELLEKKVRFNDPRSESNWGEFCAQLIGVRQEFESKLRDDLQTPGALSCVLTCVRDFNKTYQDSQVSSTGLIASEQFVQFLDTLVHPLLGIGGLESYEIKQDNEALVAKLVAQRQQARQKKDFETADKIRKELEALGIKVQDH